MCLELMSEFGGLWKHQNNPAGTKSVGVFRVLKLTLYGRIKTLWLRAEVAVAT